jgi:hypothetical protein
MMSISSRNLLPNTSVFFVTQPSASNKRLTLQHFNSNDVVVNIIAPHNSDARFLRSNEWPPPLIFDVAYGSAALKTWGVPEFIAFARIQTKNIYNNNENNNSDGSDDGSGHNGQGRGGRGGRGDRRGKPDSSQKGKNRQQAQDREERAIARWRNRSADQEADDTADPQEPDFADIVCALWMQSARKGQHQAHAMKEGRTREKVERWLESAE